MLFGGALALSEDSRFVLTDLDGRARLYDLATGEAIGDPIGPGAPPYSAVTDGSIPKYATLADSQLQIWSFDVDNYREMACRAAGRNMTVEEWEQYGPPGEAYHATCVQWPANYAYCPWPCDERSPPALDADVDESSTPGS